MRLLIHSNGPTSKTGYGVQVALLAARLADDGHEVAVSCNHGHQNGIGEWLTPSGKSVRLYPARGGDVAGEDIIDGHALHWFEGDPSGGWIIPLIDVHSLATRKLQKFQVATWTPVDHLLVPPGVLAYFDITQSSAIAMSRHGEAQLELAGLDPAYVPLAVDTKLYKPTPYPIVAGAEVHARDLFNLPREAFVVGMVAMNKGALFDRKGFSEAFYAFGEFYRRHPNAVLFLHTERYGYAGVDLPALAKYAGIPDHAIRYTDSYAYVIGFPPQLLAAGYTAMDVLVAPSHGEGFCVPLVEAQACGVPVIASNATAQAELVGAGWLVGGQPQMDSSQNSPAFVPSIAEIVDRLEQAYAADLAAMQAPAREFALQYDADKVYDEFWRPFLATLEPPAPADDKPPMERVAVVVPAMRAEQIEPLADSFDEFIPDDIMAALYIVCDPDNDELIEAVSATGWLPLISDRGSTFAQKANHAYANTDEDWLLLIGEDCRFTPGWLDGPRALSTRYDVIGTNDAPEGEVKNPDVAAGRHADHWFTRRSYIDEQGACLEGPGVFCPEAFYHWWTDKEVIELAKARGVFTPCLDSHIVHLHPGYDGDEAARAADPVYMKAVEWRERDETTWRRRAPLIEQHRVIRR